MSVPRPNTRVRRDSIVLVAVLVMTTISPVGIQDATAQSCACADLLGVNVAVYNGGGNLADSTLALNALFSWMNATVGYVNATEIRNGILHEYDIIAFPGGATGTYAVHLGIEGMDAIREFVANGGSYFGICGGSLLGTRGHRNRLGLFNGSYVSNNPGYSTGTYLTEMTVNLNSTGPMLSDLPGNYTTMFWNSAYFEKDDMSDIITVMSYPLNGLPAMIAFKYEHGTVFLSSPHPEYEEGDNRDATNNWDYLDDPDTEWNLLHRVSRWLIDESIYIPTTPTSTTPTSPTNTSAATDNSGMYLAIVGSTIGVVLVVAVIVRRR
ncbi:MAG: BPL-N domain-containing protein [Candidatus Thorarchaeota archaeon]